MIGLKIRIYVLPVVAGYFFFRELSFLRENSRLLGSRIFFFALAMLIFHWWKMDREDLRHLEREEQRAIENPQHLPVLDTGLSYNQRARRWIGLSILFMALGHFFVGFEGLDSDYLFTGTGLAVVGVFLMAM